MDDKFSIKITPEFDFKNTKILNFQKAIDETEKKIKLLKDKIKNELYKDSLKVNTPQFALKNQKEKLSSFKKELSKENKHFRLKERVEKYRLSETKRLMNQGMSFEKARREAFKKSLMSDKEKRKLEFKNLKEQGVATSKFSKAIEQIKKNTSLRVQATASMIGNTATSLFGYIVNTIKKGIAEDTTKKLNTRFSSYVFTEDEQKSIQKMFTYKRKKLDKDGKETGEIEDASIRGFSTDLDKSDFIRKATHLKDTALQLGINDPEKIRQAIRLAVRLKAGDFAESNDEAISAVSEYLKGNPEALFSMVRRANALRGEDIRKKYDEYGIHSFKNLTGEQTSKQAGRARMEYLEKNLLEDTAHINLRVAGNIEKTSDTIKNFEDKIKEAGVSIIDTLSSFVDSATNMIKGVGETITNVTGSLKEFGNILWGLANKPYQTFRWFLGKGPKPW